LLVYTSAVLLLSSVITGAKVWFEYAQLLPQLFSVGTNTGFAVSLNDTTLFFWKNVFELPVVLAWLSYAAISFYVYRLRAIPISLLAGVIPGLVLLLNPHVLLFERWRSSEDARQRYLFALMGMLPWIVAMTRQEQIAILGYSLQPAVFLGTLLVLFWGRLREDHDSASHEVQRVEA
jgi:hypothetical protein